MPNPNNCDTCTYRKDTDGGWCYMFRNEPNEVCPQHRLSARLRTPIVVIDLAKAEAIIAAFRAKYPDFHERLKELVLQHQRLSDILPTLTLPPSPQLPREDKNIRTSTKTGATWPKPKGGY